MNAVKWGMWEGGCQEQMSFGASDTMIGVRLGVLNRGESWVAWVGGFKRWAERFDAWANRTRAAPPLSGGRPVIVVLSAGAHVTLLPDFEWMLDIILDQHQALFPEVKLVWASQPGAGCGESPLEQAPDWAGAEPSYNWHLLPAFDAAARKRFAHPAAVLENRFMLDLAPLALRADAHPGSRGDHPGDCLHSCVPGPLDHLVPRTLLHLLLHAGL